MSKDLLDMFKALPALGAVYLTDACASAVSSMGPCEMVAVVLVALLGRAVILEELRPAFWEWIDTPEPSEQHA